jgi:CheY-specific phosphatase CheX
VKDIICITDEKVWKYSFVAAIKKVLPSEEARIVHINPRSEDVKKITSSFFDFIIISGTIPKKNTEEIFKLIAQTKNSKANIFLISEEFEQFNEILKVGTFPHLHLLSAPVDFDEMANHIHTIVHPISKGSGTQVTLEFLKTFVDSTKHVFKDFCMLQNISHQKPMLLNKTNTKSYDLEGSIHLHSDFFEGYFYLSFSKEIYFKILELVLGEVYTEINAGNIDFSAELVNMIYGQAKVHLNESGHNFQKVFPKFTPVPPLHVSSNTVFLIPIETEIGTIDMKVEIIKK